MDNSKKPSNTQGKTNKHPLLKLSAWVVLAMISLQALWLGSAMVGNSFLRSWNPATSAFILAYEWSHFRLASIYWKPLEDISPNLIRAVLVAEDDAFLEHEGLDLKEFKESWEVNWERKKIVRGGSTLTMQLVKNLYLSPSKNPLRKLHEILLAFDLENKVGKRRIMELYLNVVQWGEGIYGAEAASRHYFNKSAQHLSPTQSAYLAAILPNPIYLTGSGRTRAHRRKNIILRRMARRPLPKDWSLLGPDHDGNRILHRLRGGLFKTRETQPTFEIFDGVDVSVLSK
jgi:monofunctional biosynthetic peptidoglycan transglycosylase